VKGIIESKLDSMDILASAVKKRENYYLTVFDKYFDKRSNSFKNPWN
jgi:hypothetical protein